MIGTMNPSMQNAVHLSEREAMYLKNTAFLPEGLAQLIQSAPPADDRGLKIVVSHAVLEQFREAFTEQLAKVGFDAEYRPTREGTLLEGLIDRFCVD